METGEICKDGSVELGAAPEVVAVEASEEVGRIWGGRKVGR